jgi:hypothetical protein
LNFYRDVDSSKMQTNFKNDKDWSFRCWDVVLGIIIIIIIISK